MATIFHGFKLQRVLLLVNALLFVCQCVMWMIARDRPGGEARGSESGGLGAQGRGYARGTLDEVEARRMPLKWNDNWDG